MEAVGIQSQPTIQLFVQVQHHYFMNRFSANFRAAISFHSSSSIKTRVLCTSSSNSALVDTPVETIHDNAGPKTKVLKSIGNGRVRKGKTSSSSSSDAQLKENWLDSLTYPHSSSELASPWAIGIDPDVSGALALLKTDDSGISAQVFDSPHLKILIGKRVRRRLDTKSIIELLQSFGAPIGINSFWHFFKGAVVTFAILLLNVLTGTKAYLEQSIPYPQDGKQGWWSGGFNYGLWIGALVASGFSVVPVPSSLWKNEFKLSGNGSNKDDSRELASKLFPSLGSLLERKKDHGRAEALLIAAYGKGLKMKCNDVTSCATSQDSALS